MSDVELDSLVGPHELSGVDFESVRPDGAWEDANVMRFVLDGKIYVATEDPSDGYRSCLGTLQIVDGPPVKNTFGPIHVVASKQENRPDSYANNDILEFVDAASEKVVLSVGTDNFDDYYPSFVAGFNPEHLAINAERSGEA